MAKSTAKRYGIFYRSHDKWTGPWIDFTFTKSMSERNPLKEEIKDIKNNVLKTRIKIKAV